MIVFPLVDVWSSDRYKLTSTITIIIIIIIIIKVYMGREPILGVVQTPNFSSRFLFYFFKINNVPLKAAAGLTHRAGGGVGYWRALKCVTSPHH